MKSIGIINLQTYSRPSIVELCLNSLSSMTNSLHYTKLIVLQIGNKEVEKLVEDFRKANQDTVIIKVDGIDKSPLQNMNFNRWIAWEKGFGEFGADWMLSVEEDIVIHPSTLLSIESIIEKHLNNPNFKGINLGSKLRDPSLACTYSKLRFGLHGCAAVITSNTWKEICKLGIQRKIDRFPLDAAIEHILKSGYMVTPNLSMYLDYGWFQGTHTNPDPSDTHYQLVKESFESNQRACSAYSHRQVEHAWRIDCVNYSEKDHLRYAVRKFASLLILTSVWQSLYRFMRNSKRFLLRRKRI